MKMKFTPLLIFTTIICAMAVSNSYGQTHHVYTKRVITKKPTAADLEQGKELVAKSDCLSCHKLDVKLIGPAYKDVAAKYKPTEANYDLLTKKVISGGSGVWGQVAMAPHPSIPPADVKKMVEYVLSIK